MDIQELVARARIIFKGSSKRPRIFSLVNGKRSAKEIARKGGFTFVSALQELQKMKDLELVYPRKDTDGNHLKKDNSVVYEKAPLLKHLPPSYFSEPTKLPIVRKIKSQKSKTKNNSATVTVPTEQRILDICNHGEDQLYEFKEAGVEMSKLSKEISAFANTELGGIIFYGIEDDGSIGGSDKTRQTIDQSLRNSIRNSISPSLSVKIVEKDVLGHKIILIVVPPWNRKDVYQYEGRIYLRDGTNVFVAKPEEVRKLHLGQPVR